MEKVSYRLLKKLYRHGELDITEINELTKLDADHNYYAYNLRKYGFADYCQAEKLNEDGAAELVERWFITLEGRAYVEQQRKELRMFWLPYGITTLIAIAALLK